MSTKGKIEEVVQSARGFVLKAGRTVSAKEIVQFVHNALPTQNANTIGQVVSYLHDYLPNEIVKPARGLFRAKNIAAPAVVAPPVAKVGEDQFYKPLMDWLLAEGICTKAVVLGGNKWGGKWGTPDVVGLATSKKKDLIKRPEEIVTAELKIEPTQLVTAFGQACSYGLFSHRTYVVVPIGSDPEDLANLKLLCTRYGVGMVVFDHASVKNPNFDEWVAARLLEPEYEQLNDRVSRLSDSELFS